jgi:hypothetical protein
MTKVAPGVALRAERHRNRRAVVVALAITGLLVPACSTGAATRGHSNLSTSRADSGSPASPQQPGSTADCNSVTTCYGPQQIETAYRIQPLLHRGIDGRGQTVVLAVSP